MMENRLSQQQGLTLQGKMDKLSMLIQQTYQRLQRQNSRNFSNKIENDNDEEQQQLGQLISELEEQEGTQQQLKVEYNHQYFSKSNNNNKNIDNNNNSYYYSSSNIHTYDHHPQSFNECTNTPSKQNHQYYQFVPKQSFIRHENYQQEQRQFSKYFYDDGNIGNNHVPLQIEKQTKDIQLKGQTEVNDSKISTSKAQSSKNQRPGFIKQQRHKVKNLQNPCLNITSSNQNIGQDQQQQQQNKFMKTMAATTTVGCSEQSQYFIPSVIEKSTRNDEYNLCNYTIGRQHRQKGGSCGDRYEEARGYYGDGYEGIRTHSIDQGIGYEQYGQYMGSQYERDLFVFIKQQLIRVTAQHKEWVQKEQEQLSKLYYKNKNKNEEQSQKIPHSNQLQHQKSTNHKLYQFYTQKKRDFIKLKEAEKQQLQIKQNQVSLLKQQLRLYNEQSAQLSTSIQQKMKKQRQLFDKYVDNLNVVLMRNDELMIKLDSERQSRMMGLFQNSKETTNVKQLKQENNQLKQTLAQQQNLCNGTFRKHLSISSTIQHLQLKKQFLLNSLYQQFQQANHLIRYIQNRTINKK